MADSSSSWLWTEFWIVVAAMLGGAIILFGHWLEYIAEKNGQTDDELFKNVNDFRLKKSLGRCGERIVMIGIVWEILTAGIFAYRDDLHMRKIDPRNLPISTIEVVRTCVEIKGESADDATQNFVRMGLGNLNSSTTNEIIRLHFWGKVVSRVQQELNGPNGPNRQYEMQFDTDSYMIGLSKKPLTANELNTVVIYLPIKDEVQSVVVVQGQVRMIVNGTIPINFDIPPQTNWPFVATSFLTNGTFIPMTSEQLQRLN